MLKTDKINKFITDNLDLQKPQLYAALKTKFHLNSKQVSHYYLKFISTANTTFVDIEPIQLDKKSIKKILSQTGDNLTISVQVDFEVKSLEDLLKACDVDSKIWEVTTWECKKWDLGIKNSANQIETKQLYSVSAKFKARKVDSDINLQKDILLKELFKQSPVVKKKTTVNNLVNKYAYEISLPDMHFGKFSWAEESGEDYDLKIATDRFNTAISYFLNIIDPAHVDRFILPIGNDLINIDSRKGETTAGTRVDSDTRFYKIVKTVKQTLIDNINTISQLAPVDVIIVAGNHDYETMWMIGEMLEAYYYNNVNVIINNSAKQRKYYKYGKNGFMYTHGNEEKHNDLGLIFATENAPLWASSTATRTVKVGHFHKTKKLNFISIEEHTGFTLQILPSLSGTDFWHDSKGYMSKKAAKAFLYDKEQGLVAEYTYSL